VYTENHISIKAPVEEVFALGATIEEWPEILPHYRWVRILRDEGTHRLVEMAASRSGFPVKWTSIQERDPAQGAIRYRHVRGVSRGMVVEWTVAPGSGSTHVSIVHDFDPPWPRPLGPLFARYVVGDLFVRHVADKTLHHIKLIAEGRRHGNAGTAPLTGTTGESNA
jgi:uncharacterized membrane protein